MADCPKANLNITGPFGQTPGGIKSPVCVDPDSGFAKLMGTIIPLLLLAAVMISFGMLLWGGLAYITAGGDEGAVERAKRRITYSMVGLAVSFFALVGFRILGHLLGFTLIF